MSRTEALILVALAVAAACKGSIEDTFIKEADWKPPVLDEVVVASLTAGTPDACASGSAAVRFEAERQAFGFRLAVLMGDKVEAWVDADEGLDPTLALYPPGAVAGFSPQAVAWSDDKDGLLPRLDWTATSSGEYLLVLSTNRGDGVGDATLHLMIGGRNRCADLPSPARRLDVLWVVEESTSMCQEQRTLARGFREFLDVLEGIPDLDVRAAVTTTNVCPKEKALGRGQFVYRPADDATMSAECVEKRVLPCSPGSDGTDDCRERPELTGLDPENWVCETKPPVAMYSCDRPADAGPDEYPGDILFAVNTQCRYRCDRDSAPAACARVFGDVPSCGTFCSGPDCLEQACTDSPPPGAVDPAARCARMCADEWTCRQRCEAYLGDATRCERVCGAADCATACTFAGTPAAEFADANFPKQDFLCQLVCNPDYACHDRCIAEFGAPEYRCFYPGGDKSRAGCILPPATTRCPPVAEGPKVLDSATVDTWYGRFQAGEWEGDPAWKGLPTVEVRRRIFEQLLACMATVATVATPCANQEQGLLAAWMALDPQGENAEQAKSFVREDAWLVVVIVSDEDDCSSLEGGVRQEDYGICGCLADTNGCGPDGTCNPDAPGPLLPVADIVAKLRGLKPDPSKFVLSVFVGDVVLGSATTPGSDAAAARERYLACKCKSPPTIFSPLTYACLSDTGKADIGFRYLAAADAAGTREFAANLCTGIQLGQLASALKQRMLALPAPQ